MDITDLRLGAHMPLTAFLLGAQLLAYETRTVSLFVDHAGLLSKVLVSDWSLFHIFPRSPTLAVVSDRPEALLSRHQALVSFLLLLSSDGSVVTLSLLHTKGSYF